MVFAPTDQQVNDLIYDDTEAGVFRVNRRSFVEQGIFDRERDRIFGNNWIYVGHESEIPEPHDFRCRTVVGRPLILCRDNDGQVRVFCNTCTHRGAMVCRETAGNARRFRCFYHDWTYDTSGALVSIPDEETYDGAISSADLGLVSPKHVESYRGFVFVNFGSGEVSSLVDYLAGARRYLDLVIDQGENGIRVIGGSHLYSLRANWKLLVENSMDSYHGLPVHITFFEDLHKRMRAAGGAPLRKKGSGRSLNLGNGHAMIIYPPTTARPTAFWAYDAPVELKPIIEARRAALGQRHGEEYGAEIAETTKNLLIYPNLMVVDGMATTIRFIDPVAPDYTQITAWEVAPDDEPEELHQFRLEGFLSFFGPAGLATPDDIEALECCQRGFGAFREVEWSDISRGAKKDPTGEGKNDEELQMRTFWRRWQHDIAGSN